MKVVRENREHWYKYVDRVQQSINNTPPRSTEVSPFRILTGLDMRVSTQGNFRKLMEDFTIRELDQQRDELRDTARDNIARIQVENKRGFDRNRTMATIYGPDELVAIKRTQFGPGLKLRPKFLGPYRVVRKLNHDRYEVEKVGEAEGPRSCNTVAEYMKRWSPSFEANDRAGRPNVGLYEDGQTTYGRTTRSGVTY